MATTNWVLDPTHSELGFKIKHLMISNVSGSFKNFTATVEAEDEDFTTARIELEAEVASINTNNEQRDVHLRNSDFFEVEQFPTLKFRSTKIERVDDEHFQLFGDLTLKGVTRPVQLTAAFNGVVKDPWGGRRAGFLVTGKINRSDFGVSFNGVLETGGVMLGEDVKLNGEIELVKVEVPEPVAA